MSCAMWDRERADRVTFPKEPPALPRAGAEARPSISDSDRAGDDAEALSRRRRRAAKAINIWMILLCG